MVKTDFQVTLRTKLIKMEGEIPGSFKEISQVKNKLLTADCKKIYYEKKWIFLKKGTKFEVSTIF